MYGSASINNIYSESKKFNCDREVNRIYGSLGRLDKKNFTYTI